MCAQTFSVFIVCLSVLMASLNSACISLRVKQSESHPPKCVQFLGGIVVYLFQSGVEKVLQLPIIKTRLDAAHKIKKFNVIAVIVRDQLFVVHIIKVFVERHDGQAARYFAIEASRFNIIR
uniref:ORF 6 n=1 Tax=Autographa californica nuclear polyhedrosis virus TaxID=46015 RepID=Q65330_NPVAC|nr:ORF 6 [Autographa californica nucleopolyhedrovirus]